MRATIDERGEVEDVFFNLRLPKDLHEELTRLAKHNDRQKAAEVRVALRKHVDAEKRRLEKQGVEL